MFSLVRKTLIIPEGSVLSFQDSTITITTPNLPDTTFRGIYQLLVFDEDNNYYYSFWKKSTKDFNSGMIANCLFVQLIIINVK